MFTNGYDIGSQGLQLLPLVLLFLYLKCSERKSK